MNIDYLYCSISSVPYIFLDTEVYSHAFKLPYASGTPIKVRMSAWPVPNHVMELHGKIR